jgi:tRNA (guanine-N7-)-methyltransferase
MGEVLVRMAQDNPERNFVGIEQHWERIYKTLRAITRTRSTDPDTLRNIRILKIDARVVFERLFAPRSMDTVYCLFPCPWPKKGHMKHRLFTNAFLRLVNNRLKKGGGLKVVTDFYPYYEWILEQIKHTGFMVETETIAPQYDTRFERKWTGEGQREFFQLNFIKKRHIAVPVKEDRVLKSYVVDDFKAESFQLENTTGDITVICKDMVYDDARQRAMVQVLVVEEHLTQHVWIAITKKKDQWSIAMTEGQNFFPTPGIAKALELVYRAAPQSAQTEQEVKP